MAQFLLGYIYDEGLGVPQDYIEAYKWWNLSRFRAQDKEDFEVATQNRDDVAGKMTPAQIAEAQKLAREWKRKQ
jgi:TPR repeat protein